MDQKKYHIGIDIGGTKTAVALLNEEMKLIARDSFSTVSAQSCKTLTEEAYRRCQKLIQSNGYTEESLLSVGIACPGPLDLTEGRIILIPTLGYRNEPLLTYFKELFGVPCAVQKDTNAAVYYESRLGKAKGHRVVAYITISTGVGCGICIDGKVLGGEHSCAGELGHMVVVPGGRRCACGSLGCLEAYASGTSIAAIASEQTGTVLSCKEVFRHMAEGDKVATDIIAYAGKQIGYAAAALCQMIDPGMIVFGGSVTRDFDILLPFIESSMQQCLEQIPGRNLQIAVSDPEGNQTLIGAALYGKDFGA